MWARTSATAQRCSVVAHRVIEHAPLPPSEQRLRYRATHNRRRDGTKQGAAAGEYEDLFWPVPRAEASDPGDEQDDFSVDSLLEEDVVCGDLQVACAWTKPCRKQVL